MKTFLTALLFLPFLLFNTINADFGVYHDYETYQNQSIFGGAPGQKYISDPALFSPIFNAPIWNDTLIDKSRPHISFAVELLRSIGPYIFSSEDLSLVYENRSYEFVNNVRIQKFKDETLLTFWEGRIGKGYASGACVMLNQHYEVVYNITSRGLTKNGADLHECEITRDNTVIITVYEPTPNIDLSSVGGNSSDVLLDSIFQEIDIETNTLLYEWRASQHMSIDASYAKYDHGKADGWDAWHINSIQKTIDGKYVVDLRRSHEVVLIDPFDGKPVWHLGGKSNSFHDLSNGEATNFRWQHHAKFLDDDLTQLTLFDNHVYADVLQCNHSERCSRGRRLELNHGENATARLVAEYLAPAGLGSYAMGSYETMPSGNALIGWGSQAGFTEFTPDGEVAMDVQFARYGTWMRTYRVYKEKWVGLPKWNPKIAADTTTNKVYVSWNGATEVKSWIVMTADNIAMLKTFNTWDPRSASTMVYAEKTGFETVVNVPLRKARYVRAAALDKDGNMLGASDTMEAVTGRSIANWNELPELVYSEKVNAVVGEQHPFPDK